MTPHPDYTPVGGSFTDADSGDVCKCGGIRHWHAAAPYGCDDCDCTEFVPTGERIGS